MTVKVALAWDVHPFYRRHGEQGDGNMDGDDDIVTQGHHPLAIPTVLATVLAFGAGLALFDATPVHGSVARVAVAPPPAEIGAGRYEALRDRVPADPTIIPAVSRAMADGLVDEREADALLPDGGSQITTLDVSDARRDLAMTLRAYAPGTAR